MAAWQRIADKKWFDPATKDFTSGEPIEIGSDALKMMQVTPREAMDMLLPLLGIEESRVDKLILVLNVATKDDNYGR